jgi:nucleoid-associated protein YgaU
MAALGLGTYLLAAAVLSVVASVTRWHPIISLSDVLTPTFLRAVISVAVTSTALSPGVAGATPGPDSTPARSAGDPAPTMVLVDPAPAPPKSQPTTWVVRRGDNLWFIATQVEANPEKVAAYWTRLVADNRTRLRFPTDPSLIYAGQRLDLPPR